MSQLTEFKKKLEEINIHGLALDIDETLADSNTYWFENMFNFHQPEGETLAGLIKKHKFVEEVEGWGTPEAFEFMQTLLHSEEFNENVPLIENANNTVNKIDKTIPILAYITARPSTVADATKRWLRKHGFPEAELITRELDIKANLDDLADRNKWKAGVLENLYPQIIGIIDDNHVLAHKLQELNYKGTLYIYGTDTDEFAHYKHVVVCPTWDSVLEKIIK